MCGCVFVKAIAEAETSEIVDLLLHVVFFQDIGK